MQTYFKAKTDGGIHLQKHNLLINFKHVYFLCS